MWCTGCWELIPHMRQTQVFLFKCNFLVWCTGCQEVVPHKRQTHVGKRNQTSIQAKKSLTYSHDDEVRQKIFQDGGGACRHHHPSFSQSEHRKSRQLIRPKASSRTLATGLHVLRPSGATRPRGRSALVVLRQAIELEETFTPYRSKSFPKRREWCEAC